MSSSGIRASLSTAWASLVLGLTTVGRRSAISCSVEGVGPRLWSSSGSQSLTGYIRIVTSIT